MLMTGKKKDRRPHWTVGESEIDSSFNISLFPELIVNSPQNSNHGLTNSQHINKAERGNLVLHEKPAVTAFVCKQLLRARS